VSSAVPARVEVWAAPAKLTLSLRITAVRLDGYHLLEAEMITVDLCDQLEIGPGDGLEVSGGSGLDISGGDDNLVRKALAAAGRKAFVRLQKQIPAGAGLGGGSADAAAVLRWAGITDLEVAARLGADVPFCVVGGRARVRGVGEQVEPLPFADVEGRTYTLLTPPFGVATALVYRAWDRLGGAGSDGPNELEAAALHVEPRLAAWRDRLGAATGETPVLAGSGSTWFVPGAFPGEDRVVVRALPPSGRPDRQRARPDGDGAPSICPGPGLESRAEQPL
jgi:4-diphosphocytidyl-2-C-methyl-D-erythritol kinase